MKYLELKVPPLALGLLAALLMWLADRTLPWMTLQLAWAGPVAGILLAAGVAVALAGVVSFRLAGTTVNPLRPGSARELVRSGIYRATRNPMYLGMLLGLLAWALWLRHPVSLMLAPVFVLYMTRFQILPEERALASLFGQEFQDYASRVRRWL
jgi:protein-S-isoprenylcysteine O-methyltransferase Ste14